MNAFNLDLTTDTAAAEAFTQQHRHEPRNRAPMGDWLHSPGVHWCWASGMPLTRGAARCGTPARTRLADGSWWCQAHEPAGAYAPTQEEALDPLKHAAE
jgi:hypothetical protein